jgi:hypothetical protein
MLAVDALGSSYRPTNFKSLRMLLRASEIAAEDLDIAKVTRRFARHHGGLGGQPGFLGVLNPFP